MKSIGGKVASWAPTRVANPETPNLNPTPKQGWAPKKAEVFAFGVTKSLESGPLPIYSVNPTGKIKREGLKKKGAAMRVLSHKTTGWRAVADLSFFPNKENEKKEERVLPPPPVLRRPPAASVVKATFRGYAADRMLAKLDIPRGLLIDP